LIALGAEHGCEFSADDLTARAELSDEELDRVAGSQILDHLKHKGEYQDAIQLPDSRASPQTDLLH